MKKSYNTPLADIMRVSALDVMTLSESDNLEATNDGKTLSEMEWK